MPDAESSIKKINSDENKDHYIIFFVHTCPYCVNALALLRKTEVNWKGYDINDIDGGLYSLLNVLNKNKLLDEYNKKNKTIHNTKPLIFYNGKFIGGYTQLKKLYDDGKLVKA